MAVTERKQHHLEDFPDSWHCSANGDVAYSREF